MQKLTLHQEIDRDELLRLFERLHYFKKNFVSQPGEFAIRGSVVDVFPLTYRMPVRITFELDQIQSIRDFSLHDARTATRFDEVFLLPLNDHFHDQINKARKKMESYDPLTTSKDLQRGDYVVHSKYGIGKFLGTKLLEMQGEKKKHLAIEYAKNEILYVDIHDPVERFIGGDGSAPKLTKLHTKEWERIKDKAKLAVINIARDLIDLQAKRDTSSGYAFSKDTAWQKEFEAEFPFQETKDQLRAIKEIKEDMEKKRPMDRLLCGDVGYGKTEVAIRAIFKAVNEGKQVAFLVPTTVLAEQHYLVLKNRLKNFPLEVRVLSRFRSKALQKETVTELKEGKVDIVVGTHRLLSKDIQFKDLGLVVIDEEQRFGVRHKEKLKELRHWVDILALTATPIPRTLYMSLMGVRDFSAINTAPSTRLPVETYVLQYDAKKVKFFFEQELARGGQIYFVHNRVQSIEKIHKQLKEILPNVTFGIAHGQMKPAALEAVMQEFIDKRIDCLIATSIIESGLDIPNANTILVNRADQFGLSDLYQLRGRVGRFREKRQAYACFFIPNEWGLSSDASKRLKAIERFTDLGSGLNIALEDLGIRGAGNLLGHEQSGFIHAVGFDLYCRMLKSSIDEQSIEKTQLTQPMS
jgi:transcription-repair coupling factor (superfamily II helicase)